VHEAAQGGVVAIIQPGGTSDDADAVEAADARGLTMLFTGVRHFRH
jgi:phosphoribosylaminoimidazolecarboxamide formyltransferase/IMP cyclohydrolase